MGWWGNFDNKYSENGSKKDGWVSDLERIPGKIHVGKGFFNFTADQWRIFFTIYATVSL